MNPDLRAYHRQEQQEPDYKPSPLPSLAVPTPEERELARLRRIVGDIETLRQSEGDAVTIVCDNPECDEAERTTYVEVFGAYTDGRVMKIHAIDWTTALHIAADVARMYYAKEDRT